MNIDQVHSMRILILLAALLPLACQGGADEAASKAGASVPADELRLDSQSLKNAELEMVEAGPASIRQSLRIQGDVKLETERVASIVARVKGIVRQVEKKMGDHVRKGEGLMTIESKELAAAKMAYFEAEHRVEFARKALKREEQLLAQKITSKEKYLEKKHAVEEADIAHAATLQRLKVLGFAEGRLHKLKKNLQANMTRFTLRAPFEGEIIKKNVTLGEALEEEKEVFVVADLSRVWVEAKVPMARVGGLAVGQEVRVFSDTTSQKTTGKLVYIAPVADEGSRSVVVRVEVDNREGRWKPGMCARLDFASQLAKVPISVPLAAVHEIEGRQVVFVEKAEGRFQLRKVETGLRDKARVEIRQGLEPEEKVVAQNSLSLKAEWLNR